jgi:glyoxylase-like metal-dependent hydrolase (beta-lactamase superfamily II)
MRILPLHRDDPADYSCVAYWVLGERNAPEDRNTLIDTGSTAPLNLPYFLGEMARQAKGVGKRAVEQVILTHGHFDHSGGVPGIAGQFQADLYAWTPPDRPCRPIHDGMALTVGDREGLLLHTPGHSEDSVCVYVPEDGVLFSGDTLYRITDHLGAYPRAYLATLERLAALELRTLYPGHGQPVTQDASGFIRASLGHVRRSLLQD